MKNQIGIAKQSIIPLRKEAKEQSEMISQILFGELYEVKDQKGDWLYVSVKFDDYHGWISSTMFTAVGSDFLDYVEQNESFIPASISIISLIGGNYPQYIPAGSSLPAYSEQSKSFKINEQTFRFYTSEQNADKFFDSSDIIEVSYRFMNAPYLWGGRTIFGIDCSGFTQIVYKICGLKLLRDAYQQFSQGYFIQEFSQFQPGDLAFFGQSVSKITHVGILIDNEQIIHASGSVRLDKWDDIGIFNKELQKYTHKLIGIKRIENVV